MYIIAIVCSLSYLSSSYNIAQSDPTQLSPNIVMIGKKIFFVKSLQYVIMNASIVIRDDIVSFYWKRKTVSIE